MLKTTRRIRKARALFPRSRSRYLSAPTMVRTMDWSAHSHHHHSIFRNAAFPETKAPLRPHSWSKDSSKGHARRAFLFLYRAPRPQPATCESLQSKRKQGLVVFSLSGLDTRASCPLPLLHDLEANAGNITNLHQRTADAKPLILAAEPLTFLGHQLRDLVVRSQTPTLHRSHQ